jgi:hypothetical protein
MAKGFDVEWARWSLDARTAIQSALLNLVVCSESLYLQVGDRAEQFCQLSAAGFSLWRAAFLSGLAARPHFAGREAASQAAHATDIISKVVATNTVTFADDVRAQFWMGQYYIDNAGYRLDEYLMKWRDDGEKLLEENDFDAAWIMHDGSPDYIESAMAWMVEYNLLIIYINQLAKRLELQLSVPMVRMDLEGYRFEPRPASLADFLE